MPEKTFTLEQYQQWIKKQSKDQYKLDIINESKYHLVTDYGYAEIRFTVIDEFTVIEFIITSNKDNETKFYLHFELKDEDHAKKLFKEMVESLIDLKNQKTLKVLLTCSAALTTSMFAAKLTEAAASIELDATFDAVSYLSIYEVVEDYDVVLIAPQINYMYERIKDSLPEKLVLNVPTAIFASYDVLGAIRFIQLQLEKYQAEKAKKEETISNYSYITHNKRILTIASMTNKNRVDISYRLYDHGEVIENNTIMWPAFHITDTSPFEDIIDTLLVKYSTVDIIGITCGGIVDDRGHLLSSTTYFEEVIDNNFKEHLKNKYNVPVYVINNANAAVVGFSLEHPEYKSLVFHSQGYGVGGQGTLVDGHLIIGKNGIAGEIKYFMPRMQFSNDMNALTKSEKGIIEIVTKALLPSISIFGPEAIAIRCPLLPPVIELRKELSAFIPEEFIPDIYTVPAACPYMLDGIMKLCVDYIQSKE